MLTLFSNSGACNKQGGWRAFADKSKGQSTSVSVVGSTHCDGELPDRGVACALFCGGGADASRQTVLARYATTHFMAKLKGTADAMQALTQASLDANAALADATVREQSTCATPPDGTTEPPSGGSTGGGTTTPEPGASSKPPAGPAAGASQPPAEGTAPADANPPATSGSSGGCSMAHGGRFSLGFLGGVLLAAAGLFGRRRTHRNSNPV